VSHPRGHDEGGWSGAKRDDEDACREKLNQSRMRGGGVERE
jgi:hypothetical protein